MLCYVLIFIVLLTWVAKRFEKAIFKGVIQNKIIIIKDTNQLINKFINSCISFL